MSEKKIVDEKIVVGLIEQVKVISKDKQISDEYTSRIDTGATKSSIDMMLAGKLSLGPIIRTRYVKNANGNKLRPIVEVEILIAGKKIKSEFTLADRSHMKYPILIGQNILTKGFIIDPLFKR